ncbi:MAG: tryptophanase [Bacteroidales bacterium]
MSKVKFYRDIELPLEFHKARVVQRVHLLPIDERLKAIEKAGFNTYRINSEDVYLDMLTDSGTNAMSDVQLATMMRADDAYAGSKTYQRLQDAVKEIFGKNFVLPAHQGRGAENIITRALVHQGDYIPMNYHFGSTVAHIGIAGAKYCELLYPGAFDSDSDNPFKGNMNIEKLEEFINKVGTDKIPFIRMEASTNLIGGQPFSMKNYEDVRKVADKYGLKIVLDASLLEGNAYLIIRREKEYVNSTMAEVVKKMASLCDLLYFSARKLSCTRGAGICLNDEATYLQMQMLVAVYEGFVTYGGMSMKEMEAMVTGLYEMLDIDTARQNPDFIKFFIDEAVKRGLPVVTPAGVLGGHLDAKKFCDHIPQKELQAAALVSAIFICSGVRGMEGGSLSEVDSKDPNYFADMELVRLAFPRRVFTLSQTLYVLDRLEWLYDNRKLIHGMKFVDEPNVPRNFRSMCKPVDDWTHILIAKFKKDFGDSL